MPIKLKVIKICKYKHHERKNSEHAKVYNRHYNRGDEG